MKPYQGGRAIPASQPVGKTNIITGEVIGDVGGSYHHPPSAMSNSVTSHGRGKNEAGERLQQREKERKYKEELDRWVEQNKAQKAADASEDPHKRKQPPQSSQEQYGASYGNSDPYSGPGYQKSEGKQMLDANERKRQQKDLLEGYKAIMDSKKKQKDVEKERDRQYQRQQYEEILKQDYQRDEHLRKLKGGSMQSDLRSRQQQNQVSNQAGLEALDQEQARQAYEARQPVKYGGQSRQTPPQQPGQSQPDQDPYYGGAGAGEGYGDQDYYQQAYDRAMMEKGPSELNKQYEPRQEEQDSPRRQEEKGGWQYYEPMPENVDHSPKKDQQAVDYSAAYDKKRGGSQVPLDNKAVNRSAKDDYILNRQRYGNHGGFNIISHQ